MHVVDEVEVDRRAGARDRQQVLALAVAVPDLRQLGSVGRCPGSHSTNFSPISDCGRTEQRASARKGVKPIVLDAQHDRRLLVVGHVHRLDHADLAPRRSCTSSPGDRRGDVVEDRSHAGSAAAAIVRRRHASSTTTTGEPAPARRPSAGAAWPLESGLRRGVAAVDDAAAPSRRATPASRRPGSGVELLLLELVEALAVGLRGQRRR